MFLLIILRILFVFKWLIQFVGIVTSIAVMGWISSEKEIISLFSLGLLIIPELVMGCVIWISKGASAISKRQYSNEIDIQSIPVFSKNLINTSLFSYMIVLISIFGVIGAIFEVYVLSIGVTLLLCLLLFGQLKYFVEKYLHINV